MGTEKFNPIELPIKPLYDTWTWNQDGGCWGITPSINLTSICTPEVNEWYATSLTKTLDAFDNLVRAWLVKISPGARDDVEVIHLEWQEKESYQLYLEKVLNTIRTYPAPVYELSIDVDLFVYVRTEEYPSKPIQSWVRLPHSELVIWGGQAHPADPFLYLEICHTLFGPGNKEYGPITGPYPEEEFEEPLDDNELQLLNQPLLEKALKRWEEYFGSITEVDGIPGIYKYGFLVEPY
ncbi:hypothetical protein [Limnofasciculus baicalensis]|uniref:Uncharacterized protein n=1 Tax=Limnofasciculus baicalensis BBK-W-15 TaxID=2699891 RepID=A0AAE3GRY1_9CYAN|nr:hypothetical protein [Limnofasciculus baicalensis]MCP2728753.1 hypothetical protein [Limnofasciculus baicalensis BBK-W-15]